jgi:hypothetical protein
MKTFSIRSGALATIALVFSVAPSRAQSHAAKQLAGGWTPSFTQGDFAPATMSQRASMERAMQAVITVLKSSPAVARPIGYCLSPLISLTPPQPQWRGAAASKGWPAWGYLGITALNHTASQSKCVNPANEKIGEDERPVATAFDINANFIGAIFDKAEWQTPIDSDAVGPMFTEPKRAEADVAGLPTYQGDRQQVNVVIKKSAQPLFVKVTKERFLKAMAATQRTYGNVEKAREYEKLLASMSADERASQAVLRNFTTAENPFEGPMEAKPLVTPNLAFFDRTRPADLQLLIVMVPPECDGDDACAISRPAVLKALREMDWNALAALVR